MLILKTIAEMRAARSDLRCDLGRNLGREGKTLGLVPTMGALHAGHLSLVAAARASCDAVVVSIFVNPAQFGPNEDLARYPRTFEADCALLLEAGADIVFAPPVQEMYPATGAPQTGSTAPHLPATYVTVEGVSERLDGASRPGHFRGVSTVVSKLFHIAAPDRAFFGQKDAAQVAVLRKMVADLNFDVEMVVCPIVRDADGLALSSRNRYLTLEERRSALVLHRALGRVEEVAAGGETSAAALIEVGCEVLAQEPGVRLDYFSVVDRDTLLPVQTAGRGTLVAVAAFVGTTRLIDNVLLL
ncbi:MAG TPA: pantoate--beta-alanine ligase [Acidisarcina sp.]